MMTAPIKYFDALDFVKNTKDTKELEVKIGESKTQAIIWMGSMIIVSGLLQHLFK